MNDNARCIRVRISGYSQQPGSVAWPGGDHLRDIHDIERKVQQVLPAVATPGACCDTEICLSAKE